MFPYYGIYLGKPERGYKQPINKYSEINPKILGKNVLSDKHYAKISSHRHTIGHRANKHLIEAK